MMPADQEAILCDALCAIDPAHDEASLRAESYLLIHTILECSNEYAREVLDDLCLRSLITAELTPRGGDIGGRTVPIARLRWSRPTGRI
jgi:hypothetical protein